ncbi:tyrosine-type recombinase/integrase [Pseudomonas putida]|uniref:tyrosine-type recombinase/integrase n=2 Tax=Pseudomonas putida TaxID=303 RepID=UPI001E375E02|nr:tyrosine-type recombinase/integrase [Pseudomonas putida]MCE0974118.1 site-specific integrase [Pseudomonas putida]HDS1731365.1 tyrosine-type recombinase/integrase [Pseudomonas putida]
MATLESIVFKAHRAKILATGSVEWLPHKNREVISQLPQIMWNDASPWREANLWAMSIATSHRTSIKSVWSQMKHVYAYANWLEDNHMTWWNFPDRESDRCLVQYRGALIRARDAGNLAPTTTQQRMYAVIKFYRWLIKNKLLSDKLSLWNDNQIGIVVKNAFGYTRTIIKNSSDLAIPCNNAICDRLEDGLTPVTRDDVKIIMNFAEQHASVELYLMLRLGFNTGMRFGSISSLRISSIHNAVRMSTLSGYGRINLGPGARPAVQTKYGVNGEAFISHDDLALIEDYCFSSRRLRRAAKAAQASRDLIFLTRFGKAYGSEGSDFSQAINVELSRLRKRAAQNGLECFQNFHFHQTRCTFATELARVALPHGLDFAIQIVKEALLHRNESTTLRYIKFVEKDAIMKKAADTFYLTMLYGEQGNESNRGS